MIEHLKVRDNIMEGLREGRIEGRKLGLQEGFHKKAIEDAKKLLADEKYTALEISELLNIPVEAFAESK